MPQTPASHPALPLPMPPRRSSQIALVLFRRLARHGLHDSGATTLALAEFGRDFRKVLVLARALIAELARSSRRSICIAPCCAFGMTRDEGLMLALVDGGGLAVHAALTDDGEDLGALTTATALRGELERAARVRGWRG